MSSNMSAGQIVGGLVGAVVGFFTPVGPALGFTIGSSLGGLADPPKGPSITQEGPRLDDLTVQTSTYGASIPVLYGTAAVRGNVFWLENNRLRETVTKTTTRSGGKGGGGGSKTTTTTYSYSATFAVGLCRGPIKGVQRIWAGAKLIYDAGSSDYATVIASNQASTSFRVYNGTDTQMPDARMQATLGVSGTPAYRGMAYIVFYDLQLKDYGNSLMGAQIKVELVGGGTISNNSRLIPAGSFDNTYSFASYFNGAIRLTKVLAEADGYFYIYKTVLTPSGQSSPEKKRLHKWQNFNGTYGLNYPFGGFISFSGFSPNTEGVVYNAEGDDMFRIKIGTANIGTGGSINFLGAVVTYGRLYQSVASGIAIFNDDGEFETVVPTASLPDGRVPNGMFVDESGNLYIDNGIRIHLVDKGIGSIQSFTYTGGAAGTYSMKYRFAGDFYGEQVSGSSPVFVFHPDASGNISSATTSYSAYGAPFAFVAKNLVWRGFNDFSNPMRSYLHDLSSFPPGARVPVSEIIKAECQQSKVIKLADIDVSAITGDLLGYLVASTGSLRRNIEAIQSAFPFDVVQSGYVIKFVPRGSSVVQTIPGGDLAARAGGESPGVAMTVSREMPTMLPARVYVTSLNPHREYDEDQQYAERIDTGAVNEMRVDLPMVLTSDEAAQKAEVLLYMYWAERYDVQFNLPPTYNRLEPADVVRVVTAEATYEIRITAINYTSDGRLECSGKFRNSAVYNSTASGGVVNEGGATIALRGPSRAILLDIPAVVDSMDAPGFLTGAAGYTSGWPGAAIVKTNDRGQTWSDVTAFTPPSPVVGSASTKLSEHDGRMIDKAGVLTVLVSSGSLSSVTEGQMLNGENHFAYGSDGRWEIIAAQKCALTAANTYTMTDFLRGRFGTEWATGLHQSGDTILLLDQNVLSFTTVNQSLIGSENIYRAITSGDTIDTGTDVVFSYDAVNLECLSPVYMEGTRVSGNWTLSWKRRTRIGGEWRNNVDVPVSEKSELYEVEIMDGAFATVKRTISGLTSASVVYTSADQITDFSAAQATINVRIYQISELAGRGYPLKASITRS